MRESVVVMKLLQQGTEDGMFGHPAGNTFALMSSIYGLLNDKACCCVITWNGPRSRPSRLIHRGISPRHFPERFGAT